MNAPAVAKPYYQGQWSAQARTSMASPVAITIVCRDIMTPESFAKPPDLADRVASSAHHDALVAWTIEVLEARGPRWSNFAEEAVKRALKRGAR